MYMTGTVLMLKGTEVNVVVVEGGPKAVKKYVKLMTKRIKWDAKEEDDEDDYDSDYDEVGPPVMHMSSRPFKA
jgi:U4/U6 small nuclear ribonucleoprotein PRP3